MGATTSRTGPKDNTRISNSVSSSWSYRSVIRYSRSSSFCVSFSKWEKCNRTRSKPLRSSWRSSVSALRGPFGTVTAPGSYSSSSSQERIRAMLIVFILRIPSLRSGIYRPSPNTPSGTDCRQKNGGLQYVRGIEFASSDSHGSLAIPCESNEHNWDRNRDLRLRTGQTGRRYPGYITVPRLRDLSCLDRIKRSSDLREGPSAIAFAKWLKALSAFLAAPYGSRCPVTAMLRTARRQEWTVHFLQTLFPAR